MRRSPGHMRMAQDLHDVVAHSLSVIAVQAGVGLHLLDRQPAEAGRALDAIRATSRTAAGELARLVDILRTGDAADVVPVPSLDGLDALVAQVRSAGVAVTFTVEGDLDGVPAGVAAATFRIVQEALTNVVRHAVSGEACVGVRIADGHIELRVDDGGPGAHAPASSTRATTPGTESATEPGGHGLVGMYERAAAYGGAVHAGPRPGGGFRVEGSIPFTAAETAGVRPPNGSAGISVERLRVADELHTIVMRSIAAIAHQAARHPDVELDPTAARDTLSAISTVSRDALDELRGLIRRVRSDPAR